MKKEDHNKALKILKHEIQSIHLWIYLVLRSLADKRGVINTPRKKLNELVSGIKLGNRIISLNLSDLRTRIGELAYYGILESYSNAKPHHARKYISPETPIRINRLFMDFIPMNYRNLIDVEDMAVLKIKLDKSDDMRRTLNDTIKRLREEVRLSRSRYIPEFKMVNKDGSLNKRSVEYQRLWAWFVLLDIQEAFERIIIKNEEPKKEIEYRTMAVWLSMCGLDAIEGLLSKFYMTRRIADLKEEAGDKWTGAVLRFIFGSLKRIQKTRPEKEYSEDSYKPRGGW